MTMTLRKWMTPVAVVLALAFALTWTTPTTAQTTVNSTTLSSAVANSTTNTITVASASTIVVGHVVFTDYEAMRVLVISGTTLTVMRGDLGTRASAHSNGQIVFTGAPERFYSQDPAYGSCTRSAIEYLPWINIRNGNLWTCDNINWRATNTVFLTYNSTITG